MTEQGARILGLLGLVVALSACGRAEAGPFRRPRQHGVPYRTQFYGYYGVPRGYGGGLLGYPRDYPTPTNGYGYGQAAAGYGSAYPAHPLGPGWGRPQR